MLYLDTETYSEEPIKHGTHRYAASCEVDIVAYAFDDGPVHVWDVTAGPAPADLAAGLQDPATPVTAWNAAFDRTVLRLGNLGIEIPVERWRCAMVRAMAHGLPGSLDKVGEIMGLPMDQRKHKEGRELMMLFCKPRPKNSALRRATRHTHPEEWARYLEYAKGDVLAMQALCKKLPQWNMAADLPAPGEPTTAGHRELMLWHRDQHANDRGYLIDVELAEAALRATDRAQAVLRKEVRAATGGAVQSATQRDVLLEHLLAEYGVMLPDMQKATLERRLADPELPEGLRELLRIRLEATTSSTAKYKALVRSVSADGRLRATVQFDGAQRTRRAAGRVFQPQNLPSRGIMKGSEIPGAIEALKADCEDMLYDNVMRVCSSVIRGCIIAARGHKLVVADLANIEGRGAAWLAGEEWKLQAFREFDTVMSSAGGWISGDEYRDRVLAGEPVELELDEKGEPVRKGPDLYKTAYSKAFGIPVGDVASSQRQIGKVLELFMQYEGGVGAFITGAATYGIDLDDMADRLDGLMPADKVAEAEAFVEWMLEQGRGTFGLKHKTFIACDVLKRLWRGAHPAISGLWPALKDTLASAIQRPGHLHHCGRFRIRRDGAWLRVRMPSGRFLCYPFPEVNDGALSYMGLNQYTKKWQRIPTYGGRVFENICQSFARDNLYDAKPAVEAAGYLQILEVHDELLTETPDSPEYSPEHMSALLSIPPDYAPDLPLAAAGFEGLRYRKG